MASKRESNKLSKFDRGINSKVRDQDENNVDTKPKPSNDVLKNVDRPLQLKVEMTHLVISEEAKLKILDTLKFVNGEVSVIVRPKPLLYSIKIFELETKCR